MLCTKSSKDSFGKGSENNSSNGNSPNNESIKSFKEFKTIKLLQSRDVSGSSTGTVFNDDAYDLLTFNENKNSSTSVSNGDSAEQCEPIGKNKKRKSWNNSLIRSSMNSDSYSIFNGKNRLSIAIFSDLDCVSIKDDATVIDLEEHAEENEEEEEEENDRFGDLLKPLRKYNSHESILSTKQVLHLEPEKLLFKEKSKNIDSLYLGSFTKREEKFKRSFNYLRNGQLSYLTSQPMIALNNKKAVTTTTNIVMDSNAFSSPFMLPLRSSSKKEKISFKTSDSLREHLLPSGTSANKEESVFNHNSPLVNIKTTKIDETTIDFETKTIKRKSSIIWDLPKRNSNQNDRNNTSHKINSNSFINSVPKRQPSLRITRTGEAIVDNGTQVYSSNMKLDLLKDALLDL